MRYKAKKGTKFELVKGIGAIVCGTLMNLANCSIFSLLHDLHKAYYYGLFAGKITMLEVFNSSVFNRLGDQPTEERTSIAILSI